MTPRQFQVGDGTITFNENEIIIADKAGRINVMLVISSSLWLFYSVFSILRYQRTNEEFHLWVGLFIGVGHFIVLGLLLFRSTKSELSMTEVQKISLKNRFGRDFLEIKLKNGRTNRVIKINPVVDELKDYLAQNHLIG